MGDYGDPAAQLQQQQAAQQQAASNSQLYNADGSGKANDYRPPQLPQSVFPPGLTPGTELTVNRDQLTAVATQMKADLQALQATLQQFNNGAPGGELIGGWETADGLGSNAGGAYWGISQFYQDLNAAYNEVIGFIHQTVSNYADAESATASVAGSVGAETHPGSLGT